MAGTFDARSFIHRRRRAGCPDADGPLAVDALIKPLAVPELTASDAATASTGHLDDHVRAG